MAVVDTISRVDLFPAAAKVKVFLLGALPPGDIMRNNTGDPEGWLPKLTKLEEATVASNGELPLSGLQSGSKYVLWAKVAANGNNRYTDAVLAGTAVVTSATATFTELMVGKPASGVGIPAGAFVKKFVTTGEIELSVAATTSATVTMTIGNPDSYMLLVGGGSPAGGGSAGALVGTSPRKVAVKVTSTEILKVNATRRGSQIVNASAGVLYLQLGAAAVLEQGIYLAAAGGAWDGLIGPEVWTGSVFGIGAAEGNVTVAEV